MDQTSITAAGAIDTFLVLLIGIGPLLTSANDCLRNGHASAWARDPWSFGCLDTCTVGRGAG